MKKLLLLIVLAVGITTTVFAQQTYTWRGGASAAYGTAANWNPTRTTPALDDILVFDLGNIDGANTANSITVSSITNETIGQLQIVRATGSATGIKTLTFSGTATTLTVTGNLTFGYYANGTYCRLADGGNIISVGGNITTSTAQAASCTYHTGAGKIVLTGINSSILANATSNNGGFQNIELASTATNVTFAGTLQINGDLKINSGAKLVLGTKTLSLNAATGVGGTISGSGVITGGASALIYIAGTGPASGIQTVGTINLDNSSSANCTLNNIMIQRPKAITTLGLGYNNGSENIINFSGGIRLEDGTLDDGGNVLSCAGNPIIIITSPGGQTGVHQGNGKIRINRSSTGAVVTAGRTVTLNNLEIGSGSGAVAFTVGASTNLTINGTLSLLKSGSTFDASGSTLTFQNGNTPISWTGGTITTSSSTNLYFGSAGNTGGNAFQIPNSVFTSAPTVGSITINRTNSLTLGNQAFTIANDLNLTSGTLADNGNTISVGGNITGTGSHSGTGKISMTGSSKTISAVTAIGNLDINTTGTISATAALPINGNLSFAAAGTLADGGNTITVGGNITGTAGTHLSTGSGKISMTGVGKSFTANTYGNFEIAGGINGSPISSNGSAKLTGGSTFTVTAGSYFDNGFNNLQFGGTPPNTISGTVNISGTAYTQKGNGMWGSFNSSYGWDNTIYTGATNAGITVTFHPGSTAIYTGTAGNTISALTYSNLTVTGARASGVLSFSNNIQVNGDFTFDATQGGTTTITSPSSTTFTFGGSGTQNVSFSGLGANSGSSAINFFNLAINSGANIVSNVDIPVAGSLSGTGTFSNASTKITMTGSTKNISGLSISNLEVNSAGTITTTAAPSISGTLSLTSGTLNNTSNGLTLGNSATIVRTNGTLTAVPTFGTSANVTYNGSSAVSSGNELPTSSSVLNTLTVNNTAGVSIGANTTADNLAINASGILNVAAGKQLTVSTSMTNNGTLNLLSTSGGGTATILTPTSISGTNTANVEQYLASSRNWYMSSPVAGATASAGPTYYKYVEALNNGATWTSVNSGDTYALMTGYIVKPTTATTYNFNGTLNTGDKSISGLTSTATAKTGFNLVGNPYPSYVKWSEAVRTNVENTMWYRSHNGTNYKFYTYQVGVGAGGIGVPATVTDYIPPMQAFWVKVNSGQTGSLQFLNTSRDHKDGAGSVFRAPKATNSAMKLLRLQVSNATENDETVLYFNANASDNLDGYDSQKMFNNNAAIPEIYTTAGAEKLVINGMNDLKYDTEIPLGFVSGQTNSFSIKATELKNFESGTRIILRDKVDVVDYELNGDNAYTFTSDAVNSTSRFSVLFKSPSIPTEITDAKNSNAYAYVNANNNIVISAPEKVHYRIYNAMGQLIENGTANMKHETLNTKLEVGVYVVNVNNQTIKVIIK